MAHRCARRSLRNSVAAAALAVDRRSLLASNSPIWAGALLYLLTLAAAAAISLRTPIPKSRNMLVVLPTLYLISAELASCLMRPWGKIAGTTYLAAQTGLMGQALVAYRGADDHFFNFGAFPDHLVVV